MNDAYPNHFPDNRGRDSWSPRPTRLVVEAMLAGRKTYYPVTLENVERNRHYAVTLTVSNFGVDHPEDLPDKYADIGFSLAVEEWGEGTTLEGIY